MNLGCEEKASAARAYRQSYLLCTVGELPHQRRDDVRTTVAAEPSRGDCWDNAVAESFFATLKVELVFGEHFRTRDEAAKAIFEYLEIFYNRQRSHSSIGYETPAGFEERFNALPKVA